LVHEFPLDEIVYRPYFAVDGKAYGVMEGEEPATKKN